MKNIFKFLKWAITERTASVVVLPVCVAVLSFIIFKIAYKTGYVDGIIEANQVSYKRGYANGLHDQARLDSIRKINDTITSDSITRAKSDSIHHLQILKELDIVLREGLKRYNINKRKNPSMKINECKLKNKVAFYLRNEGWADTINDNGEFEYVDERDDQMFVCNRIEKDSDKYFVYATYISCYDQFLDDFPEQDGSVEVILTQQMYDELCKKTVICTDSEEKEFPTYLTVLSSTPKELFEDYEKEYGQ